MILYKSFPLYALFVCVVLLLFCPQHPLFLRKYSFAVLHKLALNP